MAVTQMQMRPSDIRFTQNSISEHFGNDSSETIENTFRELLVNPDTVIRRIQVSQAEGVYWAMYGNRRLYVYQALQRHGRVQNILVDVKRMDSQKFESKTTNNEGSSIYIRQDHGKRRSEKLEARLERIYRQWDNERNLGRRSAGDIYGGGSTPQQPAAYQPAPRVQPSYQPPPRPAPTPARPAPPPKDESWCTIL